MRRAVATLCVILAVGAAAAETQAAKHLARAVKLRVDLDHEKALAELDQAKSLPRTRAEDVSLAILEGVIWAELANFSLAERHFKVALALDRNAALPADVAPKVRQLLADIRAQLGPPSPPPAPERQAAKPLKANEPADDFKLARSPRQLTITGQAFGDFMSRQLGVELAFGVRGPLFDLRLGAVIGGRLGFQVDAGAHFDVSGALGVRIGLRGAYHSLPNGVALGAGVSAGPTYEIGPGRALAAFATQLYLAPSPYLPFAGFVLCGYEVDL